MELSKKLYNLSREQHTEFAARELRSHYASVFQNRNTTSSMNQNSLPNPKPKRKEKKFRVALDCYNRNNKSEGTFMFNLETNLLRELKTKVPFEGTYRFFTVHPQNQFEEVEDDDTTLPYQVRGDRFLIHCRVFIS